MKIQVLDSSLESLYQDWKSFLEKEMPTDSTIQIIFDQPTPLVQDNEGRKMRIDFIKDRSTYHKVKKGLQSEPLSRALGGGKKGLRLVDFSAGLGVDAIFLSQLGFQVTAVERNPIVFMCLKLAWLQLPEEKQKQVQFEFSSAQKFIQSTTSEFDVGYFDPMFPAKAKSALPKQEMVIFKELVGADPDSEEVVASILQANKLKRLVVKRPLSAVPLMKPQGQIEGKIIRYDIYGA